MFADILARLRVPLIAAPMLRVSGPDLVIATCRGGAIGAFPTANCRSTEELDAWLMRMRGSADAVSGRRGAPFAPNLIIRNKHMPDHLACLVRNRVELVITSVGSPADAVGPLHDAGCLVLADVASLRHAEKALEAGADGLVLLTAGAGGQTGWVNPFAFVRAVRAMFDGPLVLSGGVSDGASLFAARALGCDLAYMGTSFIATAESMAADGYKAMLVRSSLDDVLLTRAFTGLQTNMLRPSIIAAGLDPGELEEVTTPEQARARFGGGLEALDAPRRWTDIWSAGHTVSGVSDVVPAADLVARIAAEYETVKAVWRPA